MSNFFRHLLGLLHRQKASRFQRISEHVDYLYLFFPGEMEEDIFAYDETETTTRRLEFQEVMPQVFYGPPDLLIYNGKTRLIGCLGEVFFE